METADIKVLEYSQVCEHPALEAWLLDLYDDREGDNIDYTLNMFYGDPEHLEIGGVLIKFVDVDIEGDKYVIYIDSEYSADVEEVGRVLRAFFRPDYKKIFSLEQGTNVDYIGYRNGRGYHYTTWYFDRAAI